MVTGLVSAFVLPGPLAASTRGILAWDAGVLVFLALSGHSFATQPPERMPVNAEAQQEGQRTIFWLTLGVVIVSFVAVTSEFLPSKTCPKRVALTVNIAAGLL